MLELIDTQPDISVQESEYKRLLGYPAHHVLDGRSRELADWARQWHTEHGRPWIYARQSNRLGLFKDRLTVNDIELSSKQLHDQFAFAEAHSAILVAVSAGPECEEMARLLWQESKPDEYFFMEIFGSAVVEHLTTVANGQICGWADQNGMVALPHYSPGYSGWEVSDQTRLWGLIRGEGNRRLPGEISVMNTGMLQPKKSLLALVGITRRLEKAQAVATLVPCENCSLPRCQYRRAHYKYSRSQIEDVHSLQSRGDNKPEVMPATASGLSPKTVYSINIRALRKWSQERLQLKTSHDGSIEARFRFEGTTCSNQGWPLEYDYHVCLTKTGGEYRIKQLTCVPAPGDTGYSYQCEFINNAEAFMRTIAGEKPLLGKPLNEVLIWKRPYKPSGCYCDAEGRAHKWGLVFEVIHFALIEREKELTDGQPAEILK